jgi:hypothetical protein
MSGVSGLVDQQGRIIGPTPPADSSAGCTAAERSGPPGCLSAGIQQYVWLLTKANGTLLLDEQKQSSSSSLLQWCRQQTAVKRLKRVYKINRSRTALCNRRFVYLNI